MHSRVAIEGKAVHVEAHLSLRKLARVSASAGVGDHSKIFFAQYMRMKPCIFPVVAI